MPTYRNMKVSAINDIVAKTCLEEGNKSGISDRLIWKLLKSLMDDESLPGCDS